MARLTAPRGLPGALSRSVPVVRRMVTLAALILCGACKGGTGPEAT